MSEIVLRVNRVCPTLNRWQRMGHWVRKAHKDAWIKEILLQRPANWNTIQRCKIHIDRGYVSHPADYDNIISKPILDALVRTGVLEDDNPNVVTEYRVSQTKHSKKEVHTLIRIVLLD